VGECTGQGVCSSGDVETADCGEEGTQARECGDECSWTEFSECVEPDPTERECTSALGGICDSDADCCDGWSCLGSPEEPWFADGYCSSLGCESDADCGEGLCASVFGAWTCLAPCDDDDECAQSALCLDFGGDAACAPSCEDDGDCTDPDLPICLADGGCGPDETGGDIGPEPDVGTDVGPDAGEPDVGEDVPFDRGADDDTNIQDSPSVGGGEDTAEDDGDASGGGCSASRSGPGFAGGLLLTLFGVRRRRNP
jgi:MYXO-CTERM domain-containing protein